MKGRTHLLTQLYLKKAIGPNGALSSRSKRGKSFPQYFSGFFFAEISCSRGQEEPACSTRDSKPKPIHLMKTKPWGVGMTMTFNVGGRCTEQPRTCSLASTVPAPWAPGGFPAHLPGQMEMMHRGFVPLQGFKEYFNEQLAKLVRKKGC